MINRDSFISAALVVALALPNAATASIVTPAADTGKLEIHVSVKGAGKYLGSKDVDNIEAISSVPVSRSVSATANDAADLGTSAATASIALNLTSPDTGTLSFDYQSLIAVTSPDPTDLFEKGEVFAEYRFAYNFTPTVDSLFTTSWAIDQPIQSTTGAASVFPVGAVVFYDNDASRVVGANDFDAATGTASTRLVAGIRYSAIFLASDSFVSNSGFNVLTGHESYNFAITALPTDPTVPAPGSGSLLLAGLLLMGIRRRKRPPTSRQSAAA